MLRVRTFAALLALSVGATAAEAHFDVRPYLSGGAIVSGGFDDSTSTNAPELRAFGYDFGEDPGDPFTIGDPGFNAVAGALTANTALNFQITSNLRYWNGSGLPVFADVSTGEAVFLTPQTGAGSLLVTGNLVTLNGGPVTPSFAIGISGVNGSIHRHNGSQLRGSDGNAVPAADGLWGPGDGVEAAAGIYAYEMRLNLAGANASLPFWVVYNNGLTEESHDLAIDALAESYVVPEPASLLVLAPAALGLILRRRKMASR